MYGEKLHGVSQFNKEISMNILFKKWV